ncbi:glycohydrolase toxin TNT-related protein [Litorihabitans aurantiacus]|uniref:TNT domain-containing protein n=1 Tax=Litorihabitans aurantiacus TaxID=1930061 RepID=A0AA37UGE6_9MICO|nr:glycohydrolase toxin TNT-related protein [Litorihabitans aurantiacus]GMA30168.1 hypothetical protein GCM10025875_01600 [Litorihabitans aurantiacus]
MEQDPRHDSARSTPVAGAIPPPPTRPAFPADASPDGAEEARAATHPAPLPAPAEHERAGAEREGAPQDEAPDGEAALRESAAAAAPDGAARPGEPVTAPEPEGAAPVEGSAVAPAPPPWPQPTPPVASGPDGGAPVPPAASAPAPDGGAAIPPAVPATAPGTAPVAPDAPPAGATPAPMAAAAAPSAPVTPPATPATSVPTPPGPPPAPEVRPPFSEPDLDQTHVRRPAPGEPQHSAGPSAAPPQEPSTAPPAPLSPVATASAAVPAPTYPERAALVTTVADALRAAAEQTGTPWASAHLEWSQAGTQHSGRAYVYDAAGALTRLSLPDPAVNALAELRSRDAAPGTGTWLSAHLALTPDTTGEPHLVVEHARRPYWNTPQTRMLIDDGAPVPDQPFPSDEQWVADLATFPRAPEHVPDWLRSASAGPGAASAALRERLTQAQYPGDAVVLIGDPAGATPLEGALELRQTGPQRFAVGVRDYGVFESFHSAGSEREAADWLWDLLVAPLPAATPVAAQDLQHRSHAYQGAYAQIFAQLQAGGGALLTTLPPGVALDRLGSIDGIFLFPWATPIPNRSLPASASGPNTRLYQFVTTAPLHVEAEIVPPWFGQPGGSLRFRIAADGVGVRQLVTSRALLEVRVA